MSHLRATCSGCRPSEVKPTGTHVLPQTLCSLTGPARGPSCPHSWPPTSPAPRLPGHGPEPRNTPPSPSPSCPWPEFRHWIPRWFPSTLAHSPLSNLFWRKTQTSHSPAPKLCRAPDSTVSQTQAPSLTYPSPFTFPASSAICSPTPGLTWLLQHTGLQASPWPRLQPVPSLLAGSWVKGELL